MQRLFPSPAHQLRRSGERKRRMRGGCAGTGLFNADSPGALSSLDSLHHHNRGFIISNGLPSRLLFSLAFPPPQTALARFSTSFMGEKKSIRKNKHSGAVATASESIWILCVFLLLFSRGLIVFTAHTPPPPRHSSLLLGALICSPALDGGIRKSSFCSIPC